MISIAVSAVLRPSALLRLLVGSVGLTAIVIACLVVTSFVGEMQLIPRMAIGGICLVFAGLIFASSFWRKKMCRLDISGTGAIRLMVYRSMGADVSSDNTYLPTAQVEFSDVMRMMDGSTIWPQLLLLLLQAENGRVYILPILPDCTSAGTFRAIATACRWIAGHNEAADTAKAVDTKIF